MSRQGTFKAALFAMVANGSLSADQALALVRKLETDVDRFDLDRGAADLLGAEAAGGERDEPIAVIGMAGRFGDCANLDSFWAMIEAGRSSIRPLPQGRWSDTDCMVQGGFLEPAMVSAFDPFFFRISPTEAALMDPQQRLFLEVAYEAFEDAAYGETLLAGTRCGVFVGAGAGDYSRLLDAAGAVASPLALMGNVASILAARIAYHLNLKGPAMALDTACSSSLVAVHLACESLRRGECDMALAGGVCVINTGRFAASMTEAGMLSPSGRCHSFDARADGFVCGEGAGAIVLKRLSDAQRDRDSIRGVILGSGTNQDGRTNGITAPSAPAQAELERAVYDRFGIDPRAIGYVEAHGTGTPLGDPIEVEALTESFGAVPAGRCPIGSVKTNLGHALTAAGIAGVLKLLLMLRAGTIPGAPDFEEPNPRLALEKTPFHVPTRASAWVPPEGGPRVAVVSSFGFSGTNAHLVLAEAPTAPAREPKGTGAYALLLAAKSSGALQREAEALARALAERSGLLLEDVAFSLACRATPFEHRAAIVAADRPTAIAGLGAIASGAALPPVQDGSPASAMATRWIEQGKVELEPLRGRRVSLPTYPFERVPCLPPGLVRAESARPEETLATLRESLLEAEPSTVFAGHGEGFGRVEALGRRLAAAALFEAGLGGDRTARPHPRRPCTTLRRRRGQDGPVGCRPRHPGAGRPDPAGGRRRSPGLGCSRGALAAGAGGGGAGRGRAGTGAVSRPAAAHDGGPAPGAARRGGGHHHSLSRRPARPRRGDLCP